MARSLPVVAPNPTSTGRLARSWNAATRKCPPFESAPCPPFLSSAGSKGGVVDPAASPSSPPHLRSSGEGTQTNRGTVVTNSHSSPLAGFLITRLQASPNTGEGARGPVPPGFEGVGFRKGRRRLGPVPDTFGASGVVGVGDEDVPNTAQAQDEADPPIETERGNMNLQGQDWDTVVIRKKAPSGSAAKDKDAINAVRANANDGNQARENEKHWRSPTQEVARLKTFGTDAEGRMRVRGKSSANKTMLTRRVNLEQARRSGAEVDAVKKCAWTNRLASIGTDREAMADAGTPERWHDRQRGWQQSCGSRTRQERRETRERDGRLPSRSRVVRPQKGHHASTARQENDAIAAGTDDQRKTAGHPRVRKRKSNPQPTSAGENRESTWCETEGQKRKEINPSETE